MQKQEKSRKPLIIGIIAAVVILAALLAVLLTQCVGGQGSGAATPATEDTSNEVPTYQLYWNLDRAEYAGKSEAGMSSRMPEEDGYFHVRFFAEGEIVTLKIADRKLINSIDVLDVMGLEFDEDGIVIGVLKLEEMPLEKVGWQFCVQSAARTTIKLNSSDGLNGMEVMLENVDPNRVWDMTGKSGPVGSVAEVITYDKIMAVQNLAGEITHVFIFDRPNWMMSYDAYCEHCKETVTWYEWVKTAQPPAISGHYQLQNDITMTGGQLIPAEDTKICLDLNGYRIDGKNNSRVYAIRNVGTMLAIMDTSEKQTGVIATHGAHDQGGPVWLTKGALYLYGGALDASDATTQKGGTALSISNGAYFYMYGGAVVGGTSTYVYNAETNKYSAGVGGAITCYGKMVMNGGEIRDGHAEAAVVYKDGAVDSYQRGLGGNIYFSGAEFEMNGGTIKNGRAGSGGGNLYVDGTTEFTMNGGSIQGGVCYGKSKNGGNVSLGSKTTFTMNGGSITGGVSYNAAGNVYTNGTMVMTGGSIAGGACYSYSTGKQSTTSSSTNLFIVNGNVTMWGGTIAGGVSVTDTNATDKNVATITLYGYAQITGGPNGVDLSVGNNDCKVVVGTLYDGAKIGVSTTKGVFSEPTKKENLDNFYSNIEGAEIVYYNECLGLGRANCICGKSHGETVSEAHNVGCDGKVLFWVPWTSGTSLPTTSGNYFLTKNVTTKSQTTILNADQDVKLDLNGKNITLDVPTTTADGFRLYRVDRLSKLAITDTTDKPGKLQTLMPGADEVYAGKTVKTKAEMDKDGNVIKDAVYYTEEEMRTLWANGNFGMLLWARGGEISVHNGILDGSNLTGNKSGMVVSVGSMSETNEETGVKTTYYGTVNVYGGTILCGYTKNTGNIFMNADCVLNMYGGEITGGRANDGGNVYVPEKGVFNMYGGTISNGVVDRTEDEVDGGLGGNVFVRDKGVMNMYGGTITGGKVTGGKKGGGHGGNIYVDGILNAEGGLITDGWANGIGGNIGSVSSKCTINLAGVKVTDGNGVIGGNVGVIIRANNGISITNGTVLSGGHARGTSTYGGGGNLGVRMSSNTNEATMDIVISNATITGGTAVHAKAANILFENITADKFDAASGKQTGYEIEMNVSISDSVIDGDIFAKATKPEMINLTMGGKMTVGMGATTGLCLDSANPICIDLPKTLTAGSSVLVEGGGYISTETPEANLKYFSSLTDDLRYLNKRLFAGQVHCICGASVYGGDHMQFTDKNGKLVGCDGTAYGWARWTETKTIPNSLGNSDGFWYLGNDVTRDGGQVQIMAGTKLHLDLNGKTITAANNSRVYALWEAGAELTITDSTAEGNGKIVATGTTPMNDQGFIWVRTGTSFTLYRGTIDGSARMLKSNLTLGSGKDPTKVESYGSFKNGVTISGAKFTMFGGTVIGGTCYQVGVDAEGNCVDLDKPEDVKLWVDGSAGGAIAVDNMDMYGGVIRDGKSANNGGNVYVTGTFNMYGGEILDGSINADKTLMGDLAYGGNVYASKMYMYGGRIAGGYAWGGKNSSGGTSGGNGGNLYVADLFEGYGGTIEDGEAVTNGNVGTNSGSSVILLDGTDLYNGTANSGGNLGINTRVNNGLTITEKTTISGGKAVNGTGGNIRIYPSDSYGRGVTFEIVINGTIENGTASTYGGNIYIYNPAQKDSTKQDTFNLSMNGAAITGGKAEKGNGGSVYLYNVNKVTMNNVTITGGEAVGEGESDGIAGSLYLNSVDATITGGTISDGKAAKAGSVYISNNAKVTMNGTTVSGGKATRGGNIYHNAGTLTLSGATVTGGNATREGGNIYVNGGTVNVQNNSLITLGVAKDETGTTKGGNIYTVAELNVKDSTVSNGLAYAVYGAGNAGYYGMGGNIFNSGKSVTVIENAKIIGGAAQSIKNDGTNTGFRPGGNLYANEHAQVTLDKGTVVSDGEGSGTALYMNGNSDCVVTIKDATLTNSAAGSAVATVERGILNIQGATITQTVNGINCIETNDSQNSSGAEYVGTINMTAGTINGKLKIGQADILNLSGGTVDGGIVFTDETGTIKLSGAPGVTEAGGGVNLNGNTMTVEGALTGGKVYCSDRGYVTGTTENGNEKYFASTNGYGVYYNDSKVFFGKVSCLCAMPEGEHTQGCIDAMAALGLDAEAGDKLAMKPVLAPDDMMTYDSEDNGFWYLPSGLTQAPSNQISVGNNQALVLDMNGKTWNITRESRAFTTQNAKGDGNAILILADTSETEIGKIILSSTSSNTNQGGIAWITGSGAKNGNTGYLLSGTLDVSGYKFSGNSGAAICVAGTANHSFYMYGGTIIGTATAPEGSSNGCAVANSIGNFYLYDGVIKGGNAGDGKGGNVILTGSGKFIMEGGLITGGVASEGGNVAITSATGIFEMSGGQIDGGVYVNSDKVKITGDSIIDKGENDLPYSLNIGSGYKVDVSGLTGKIYVTAEVGNAFAKNGTLKHQENKIVESEVYKSGMQVPVIYEDGMLYMGAPNLKYCLCGTDSDDPEDHVDGCDGTKYQWVLWTSYNTLPTESGNYQLATYVDLEASATPAAGATIRLDLNGHTITLENDQNLYDFVEDQSATIIVTDASKNADGQVILTGSSSAHGGMMDLTNGHTFELYRATLNGSDFTCLGDGVIARISAGGEFIVHSGKVIGGTAGSYSEDAEGNVTRVKRDGGCFLVNGGDLTINDGEIIGGTSYNCAGTIHVKTGNFYLNGGSISGGKSWEGGGSIRVSGSANFVMTGGTISGGAVAAKNGDKLVSWSDLGSSGNVLIQNTVATISGGTVMGGIYVQDTVDDDSNATLNISGKTVINGKLYNEEAKDLSFGTRSVLALNGALTEGADIWVSLNNAFVTAASEHAAASLQYIHNRRTDVTMLVVDADAIAENPHVFTDADLNRIYAVNNSNYYCECGGKAEGMKDHTCKKVIWTEWISDTAMPTVDGNYRLTKSVTLKSAWVSATMKNVSVDLNGCNITSKDNRAIKWTNDANDTLTITDSHVATAEKPIGTVSGGSTGQGGTLWILRGTLNIYDGVYESNKASTNSSGGGVMYARATTVNMFGGTIQNGQSYGNGGNVILVKPDTGDPKQTTVFNMHGGTIKDGYAGSCPETPATASNEKTGGNIYISSGTTFNMTGGQVLNGYTLANWTDASGFTTKKTIDDKSQSNLAASIDCRGNMTVSDATIKGSISIASGAVSSFSGNVIISGNPNSIADGRGITRKNTSSHTLKDLGENAIIEYYFPQGSGTSLDSYYNVFANDKFCDIVNFKDADLSKIVFANSNNAYKLVISGDTLKIEKK